MKLGNISFQKLFCILILSAGFIHLPANANVIGSDFQNFNPIPSGLDFVTVHSSETLQPKIFNFGFYYNIAYNTLPYFESIDGALIRDRSTYSDSVGAVDFNFGYGIMKNWDVGLNAPMIVNQSIESDQIYGSFSQKGLSEIRLNTKYRFVGDDSYGIAGIFTINFNQIENNIYSGDGAGPILNFEVAADKTYGSWNLAANLGYRLRSPGTQIDPVVVPYSDSIVASVAASFLVAKWDTKFIFELFGGFPTDSAAPDGQSSFESLIAAKHDFNSRFSLLGGLGTELAAGTASPDWRFFTGINYAFGSGKSTEVKMVRERKEDRIYKYADTDDNLGAGGDEFSDDIDETIKDIGADQYADFDTKAEDRLLNEQGLEPIADVDDPFDEVTAIDKVLKNEKKQRKVVFVLKNVNFKPGSSSKVYGRVRTYLKRLNQYLRKPPKFKKLIIVGHTDSIGSAKKNKILSIRRAKTIRKYLIKVHKIPANRVIARGKGESQPIADNGNYQGRKENRRVEFQIFN